ncbi:MAG: LVIVD repeat-containing protein, partial [Promethearchaeota archaeon]
MRKIVIAIIGIIVIVIAVFAFSLVFLVPGHYVGYAVRVQGNYAYVADSAGVTILDVSEPSRSSVISNLAFAHGALGIQVKNSLAFIATDSEGFAIADISDPNNPIKLGKYGETALEVCIDGSYAYITIRDVGLQILDIKNPELITKVGELNGLGRGDDVEVHQGIVYYADGSSNQGSLKVINVTDPSAPQKIKDIAGISGVFDIHICEDANLLFLACHSFGVRIMNISNPQSPSVISSYIKTDGEAYGVSGNSTHLYVADLQQGAYL